MPFSIAQWKILNTTPFFNSLQIRTSGMAIVCSFFSLSTFISLKTYLALLELVDLHGCLIIYGTGCIFGMLFVLYVLDETSGKSLDDIGAEKKVKNGEITRC